MIYKSAKSQSETRYILGFSKCINLVGERYTFLKTWNLVMFVSFYVAYNITHVRLKICMVVELDIYIHDFLTNCLDPININFCFFKITGPLEFGLHWAFLLDIPITKHTWCFITTVPTSVAPNHRLYNPPFIWIAKICIYMLASRPSYRLSPGTRPFIWRYEKKRL